jgi:carbonic anhydrase
MRSFIDHARSFHRQAAGELDRLAAGQWPQALFITCSDSRVVPSLITGAAPGELFEMRTAGNIVPHYRLERPSGEAATIEYAVEVLGVADIVVCGHSHCGAVGALARGEDLTAVPAVQGWLAHAASPLPQDGGAEAAPAPGADLAGPVQSHILEQLERLRDYPGIARRLAEDRLRLHGWFYEVHTGLVCEHRPHDNAFLPL